MSNGKKIYEITDTASAFAADDYLPIAGVTNGTRKILASATAGTAVDQTARDAAATAESLAGSAYTAASQAMDRANHAGTQAISTITNLQLALNSKSDTTHTHGVEDVSGLGALATAPVTISTEAPSGTPATGAIWFQYTP